MVAMMRLVVTQYSSNKWWLLTYYESHCLRVPSCHQREESRRVGRRDVYYEIIFPLGRGVVQRGGVGRGQKGPVLKQ